MLTHLEIILDSNPLVVLVSYASLMMRKALVPGRIPPVFDMLFSNFRNPRGFGVETGFYPGASARVADMLLFKDVNGTSNKDKPAVAAN